MITPAYVAALYNYHIWASRRVLDAAGRLAPADLDAAPLPGLGSLRATLVHTMSAGWIWRSRLEGSSPSAMLDPASFPTLAAIVERWDAEGRAMSDLIAGLDQASLGRVVAYTTTSGTPASSFCWQILAHLANHSTQHLSESAALLTALGASPGDIDMILFFRTRAAG